MRQHLALAADQLLLTSTTNSMLKDARVGNLMKKLPKRIALLGLLLISSASYTIVFAKQIRCHFVAWSELKAVDDRLYVDPNMPPEQIAQIVSMVAEARRRDAQFYGVLQATPVTIAGQDTRVIDKFGQRGNRMAVTHLYLGNAYIVLGPDGLDVDVVAHETMHAELSDRLGWLKREMSIPAWFDEGLAMQADYRESYSEEAWQQRTENGRLAPPLANLVSLTAFTGRDYWMSYATSKHELKRWLNVVGQQGFREFLKRMETGEDFAEAYQSTERKYATLPLRHPIRG